VSVSVSVPERTTNKHTQVHSIKRSIMVSKSLCVVVCVCV